MSKLSDTLIYYGGPVKATRLEDGRTEVSGLCVIFDAEEDGGHDLEGEFFSAKSFFGPAVREGNVAEFEATFNHGFAPRKELTPLAEHEFANPVKVAATDTGLMASLILEESDAYEAMLAGLAEKGKLKWSSGSATHRIKRVAMDDGRTWLKRWPIVEVALTHTPMEPRTKAAPVKAIPLDAFVEATKAESLSQKIDRVYRAFYDQHDGRGYVAEVFDDHVIAEMGGSYYRAAYSEIDGEITFADSPTWEKVQRKTEWIPAKAAYLAHLGLSPEKTDDGPERAATPTTTPQADADEADAWAPVLESLTTLHNLIAQ